MEFIRNYNKTAIIYEGREYSYLETIKKAKAFVEKLNIQREDKALIFMENRPEFIYSFLGIWDKKGTCVCVDGSFNGEELAYYLGDCEPKYIFTSENNVGHVRKALEISGVSSEIINVDDPMEEYKGTAEVLM
ncbi:MAG: AMP-binding protein, partial [Cetobacterium sp.]